MSLFPDVLVQSLREMPGASHSFLRQLCEPDAADVRQGLGRALAGLDSDLRVVLEERLSSLDNRVFFQGFSELAVATGLIRAGWTVGPGQSGQLLQGVRPSGESTQVLVLGFIHSQSPGLDRAGVQKLVQALERVGTTLRFAVYVRRWLPPDFDPEPVRRAVELWLRECEDGAWEGTQAAYEDEGVALEFKLSGGEVQDGQSPVAMTLGPFVASRVMMALEQRVIQALDRVRLTAQADTPVLVAAVADQPWQLTRGYVREFLYGKPRFTRFTLDQDGSRSWEAGLSPDPEPCLFKDPVYRDVCGMWLLERPTQAALSIRARGYANPFARQPLTADQLSCPVLHGQRKAEGLPVVGWSPGSPDFMLGQGA